MRTADATVACGSCTACCRGEAVFLQDGEEPLAYGAVPATNPLNGRPGHMIPHGPDGACIHLGEAGCRIYARRPKICRVFSCVGMVRQMAGLPRQVRRRLEREGMLDGAVYAAGKARV